MPSDLTSSYIVAGFMGIIIFCLLMMLVSYVKRKRSRCNRFISSAEAVRLMQHNKKPIKQNRGRI